MIIVLLVEGDTEQALKGHLKHFLDSRSDVEGKPRVRLQVRPVVGRSKGAFMQRVRRELQQPGVTAVVGLIDVYPDYGSAAAAKDDLKEKAGHHPNFYAHAAQYDVEAWLLPFWDDICRGLGLQQRSPGHNPEQVDGVRPPSRRLMELYRLAKPRPRKYSKPKDMYEILARHDLADAAAKCPELKALLNTLLKLSGLTLLP
jgi:hypothetical protein